MDPQLWKQVDALFEAALEQPPEKRKSFVGEASKGNAIIYEEVLSLLDAQARAAEFMEGSAMSVAAGALAQELTTIATLVGKEVGTRSEEHTSELQSRLHLVCRLLLEKKKKKR